MMKRVGLLWTAILCLSAIAKAFSYPSFLSAAGQQARLALNLPPNMSDQGHSHGPVSIADVIGAETSIAIFAQLAQDVESVYTRFMSSNSNSTVLAPSNAAISALPRKPWEDADDYEAFGEEAYEGSSGGDRARANLEKFVEAHIVPVSPWESERSGKTKTLAGNEIEWEDQDGTKMIKPFGVKVERVRDIVSNGQVWILNDVLMTKKE